MPRKQLQINPKRLKTRFDELSRIGTTGEGGVHRPTFSNAHFRARAWLKQKSEELSLQFKIDGAGNHSALLACGPKNERTLLLGSHLDSVPNGGRFDGALGVVAALEVLNCVQENELALPYHLELIDFTDEEGTLLGLLGSTALSGQLSSEDFAEPRGGKEKFLEGLAKANLTEQSIIKAKRAPRSLAGYLELHIEQGSRLIEEDRSIGIVDNIVGIGSYRITFIGESNHAGTTTMEARRDAALGACSFTLETRKLVIEKFPGSVANIGKMEFLPGAFNIIPGSAILILEYRSPERNAFIELENALLELAHQQAERFHLSVQIDFLGRHQPVPMNESIQDMIEESCKSLGLSYLRLPSGAGHDAQSMNHVCPSGMIFVPSVSGISHSPLEFTQWSDCVNGANVLLQTALSFIDSY